MFFLVDEDEGSGGDCFDETVAELRFIRTTCIDFLGRVEPRLCANEYHCFAVMLPCRVGKKE